MPARKPTASRLDALESASHAFRGVRFFSLREQRDGTFDPPLDEHDARVRDAEAAGYHAVTLRVVRVNTPPAAALAD